MNGWVAASLLGVLAALLPSLYILLGLLQRPNENWRHIQEYMLKDYVTQSLLLIFWTGLLTVILGVALAWLIAAYDFPLRKFFRWAFILPLAIPPYVGAYTYSQMFSYTGTIQKFFRNQLGLTLDQKYFDIMSMKGAVFIFTMFLFPYVYTITRTFLERQSSSFIENARILGKSQLQIFFQVVLPLSQAAIVGGVSLVIFEVLNDYGVASYFGLQTFTTAIFKTWFGMYDVDSALRLAALMMVVIIGVFIMERYLRRRRQFSSMPSKTRPLKRQRLRGLAAAGACVFGLIVFALSFFIPLLQLIVWATWTYSDVLNDRFYTLVFNTLYVSLLASVLIVVLAVIVANVYRLQRNPFTFVMSRLISMGYSIPGAVVAIGVLAVFLGLDRRLTDVYAWLGLGNGKLVLSLSLAMLIVAYIIRFLAVGYNSVEVGFEKIGNRYHEAARLLGMSMTKAFFKVDLPLIKGSILTGLILSFMEIVKELPLTLLLRPFNFDTLATKTFQYASDEQILQASVPSLIIIGISFISVFIYHRLGEKNNNEVF